MCRILYLPRLLFQANPKEVFNTNITIKCDFRVISLFFFENVCRRTKVGEITQQTWRQPFSSLKNPFFFYKKKSANIENFIERLTWIPGVPCLPSSPLSPRSPTCNTHTRKYNHKKLPQQSYCSSGNNELFNGQRITNLFHPVKIESWILFEYIMVISK